MRYKYTLIDGLNTLYRAAHVARILTVMIDGKETQIGGVYQFIRILLHVVETFGDDSTRVIVCWEGSGQHAEDGWRRREFAPYKAKRADHNQDRGNGEGVDIPEQERLLRALLSAVGWSQAWSPDHEADDTIATLASRLETRGPVGIVTLDHDLHQCVGRRVHVLGEKTWTVEDVKARWGLPPLRIPEFKALAGDVSDGIPGVHGVGKKRAGELLSKFANLEDLLTAAHLDVGGIFATRALRASLVDEADLARLFLRLTTTVRDAPVEFAPRGREPVRDAFSRLRFSSLMAPSTLAIAERLSGR